MNELLLLWEIFFCLIFLKGEKKEGGVSEEERELRERGMVMLWGQCKREVCLGGDSFA